MNLLLPHRRKAFQAPPSSFPTDQLVGFWPTNETSGNALDSFASYDLNDTNGVGSAANEGPDGDATVRTFDGSNQMFARADDAFNVGAEDSITAAGWGYLNSSEAANQRNPVISKKASLQTSQPGYLFAFEKSVDGLYVRTSEFGGVSDGSTAVNMNQTNTVAAPDEWFYWVYIIDRTADVLACYVNNVFVDSVNISSVNALDTSSTFRIGGTFDYWNGGITHVGFWAKALDSDERAAVYNGGSLIAP